MKNISFKVEDNDLERLNYYRTTPEGGKAVIAEFVKAAILERCEKIRHLRAGGLILNVPNPDIDLISDDEKAKIMQVLRRTDAELAEVNPLMGSYLTDIIAYLQHHFYAMPDKQRKMFEENLSKDLVFEAKLDFGDSPDETED